MAIIFIIACVSDIKSRTISNRLVAVATLWLLSYVFLFSQLTLTTISIYMAIVLVGVFLSNINVLGAGDSKLMAAVSLALTPYQIAHFILLTFLFGGVLAVLYFCLSKVSKNERLACEYGIPYGVAISASAMFTLALPF